VRPKQNFDVGLSNALLEAKHYHAMGEALWLYIYLLDRQTRRLDKDGLGQVAGGVPIRDSDISGTIGSSRRTVIRWRGILLGHGYITARRTPYGYSYAIAKPKKWAQKTETDVTRTAHLSTDGDVRVTPRDVTRSVERCDIPCTNKEEIQRETSSSSSETTTAVVSKKQMEDELQIVWNYYLSAFDKQEILFPSSKRMGMAVLSRFRPGADRADCVGAMASAIDMAHYLVKHSPKKAYFSRWESIFGKFDTFRSLFEQHCNSPNVPPAASLPED
jgi:hypothetical protein